MRVVLISTYELGRQPFGLASAAAWLRDAGAEVTMQDLSICSFDPAPVRKAGLVGVFVPMHTAARLAETVIARVREANPNVHVSCFGLYAAMNAAHLIEVGANTVVGGEFEPELVAAYRAVEAGERPTNGTTSSVDRLQFKVPLRAGLPALHRYAKLQPVAGPARVTGYTEASRGCRHLCRHCPVVPVYQGRFVVVEPDVVLADIRAQVAAGAEHVTFGDPDFFNGPAHALRVVRSLQAEFPSVTYDVTIKVEHLRRHVDLLPELRDTGCVLVTTAVESFDDAVLERFDKRHEPADFEFVLTEMRRIGLAVNPTFVAFTPWTSAIGYLDFLERVADLGLVGSVAPIQYGIRLLIPEGSLLADLPEVAALVGPFDERALVYPWRHPDPRLDRLCDDVLAIVRDGDGSTRAEVFGRVWQAARALVGDDPRRPGPPLDEAVPIATVPYLTEPWYC